MKNGSFGILRLGVTLAGAAAIFDAASAQSAKSVDEIERENAGLREQIRNLETEKANAELRQRMRRMQAEKDNAALRERVHQLETQVSAPPQRPALPEQRPKRQKEIAAGRPGDVAARQQSPTAAPVPSAANVPSQEDTGVGFNDDPVSVVLQLMQPRRAAAAPQGPTQAPVAPSPSDAAVFIGTIDLSSYP